MLNLNNKIIKSNYSDNLSILGRRRAVNSINVISNSSAVAKTAKRNIGKWVRTAAGWRFIAAPATIVFLKKSAVNGAKGVAFYTGWRAIEISEDYMHALSGGKTYALMTKAQQQAHQQAWAAARESIGSRKGPDGGCASAPYEEFISSITALGITPVLMALMLAMIMGAFYILIGTGFSAPIKKLSRNLLNIFGLTAASWAVTKAVVTYIRTLDSNDRAIISQMQDLVENSEIRFIMGAFIAGLIVLATRKALAWYGRLNIR